MCKVSVIIPVYNTASYLYEAIGSIVSQSLSDIEIICVDDGSTDSSLSILQELTAKDNRIKVFHQKNQGQSSARNTAMKYACGKYVYFMDSDDILCANALQDCYDYCERHQFDFCFFDGDILMEGNAKPLSWDYRRTGEYREEFCYDGMKLMETMLNTYTYRAVPWLLFIRHDYIKKIGLSFYEGIIHEDELYSVLLFVQSKKIGCLKHSLVKHRVRATSTMGIKYSLRNINCYYTVIGELQKWAKGNDKCQDLINKYSHYTLDAVFRTAFVLNFRDKFVAYRKLIKLGYAKYVNIYTQLKFWIK